jgi:hypothetical protein
MRIMKFRSSIRFAAGAAVVLGCATAAQANFFERLFGTEPDPQPQQYYYQPAQPAPATEADMRRRAPIDFTVRKRVRDVAGEPAYRAPAFREPAYREPAFRDARERPARRERPRAPVTETASVPAGPIDPVQTPDWHLQDPTLRRGDIVVLKDQVLVFKGGRMPFSRADFASLSESDLPAEERERLSHMAGLKPVPAPRTTVASAGQ